MELINKNKLKSYLKEIISFILILVVAANIISYFKSNDLNKQKLFTTDFITIDNKKFDYDPNKPLLIHFWTTWCPICKVEAPNIKSVSQDYQVLTIAVDSGDNTKIKNYLNTENLNFKVVNDMDSKLAKKFNISVYPTTFIYNKNKELVFSEVGYTSTLGLKLRMFWASF
jgi:thiol-disulfide isomerase/thioredoxin